MALCLLLCLGQAQAATFVVNDVEDRIDAAPGDGSALSDAGTTTLRAAIMEANALPGADTIHVPAGVYRITIDATLADPVLDPIEPPEVEVPTVACITAVSDSFDGDLDITCPLTIIGAGANVTILDGGSPPLDAPPGRTALDRLFEIHPTAGDVSISRLTIRNGWSEDEGGAIWNASSGKVRLTEMEVLASVSTGYGGGIHNLGDMVIDRCTIAGNTTGGVGGGLFTDMGTLTVIGTPQSPTVFRDNVSASGGAIYSGGDVSLAGLPSRILIEHTVFTGNKSESGGGIFADQRGELSIQDTTFSDNYAGDYGGGIANVQKTMVSLIRVSFTGNKSAGEGGGAFSDTERSTVIIDSSFFGNAAGVPVIEEGGAAEVADAGGGGLYAAGSGTVDVRRSSFIANTATEEGGGIYIDNNGSVELTDSVISGNSAHAGGGIENAGVLVNFTRLTIHDNSAVEDGGGIESQGSGDFSIVECSIFGNVAENGGGIANAADGRLLVFRSTINDNHARGGANDDTGLGGGIYVLGDAAITIENTTVSGNFAKVRGGGIYVDADAKTRVVHCTITRNAAPAASGIGDEGTNLNLPILPSKSVFFRNTIIAGNRLSPACNYALGSEGGNVEDGDSCFLRGPRDRTNATNLGLDAIADNGGPTLTHALREGSVAIDGGVSPTVLTDQRGVSRPQNGQPDSGSVEYEGPFPPPDFLPPETSFLSMQMDDEATRSFRFDGNDDVTPAADLIYECRLIEFDPLEPPEPVDPNAPPDPALAFLPCSNPWLVPDPEAGQFTLEVRAIDKAGNIDPTPARFVFTLEEDITPPQTFFTSTPSDPSLGRFGAFTFAGADAQTPANLLEFECRIDSNDPLAWLECTNPVVFTDLTTGQHTVEVRALDLNENMDPTPARFTWTVAPPADCDAANITLAASADGWIDQVTPFENLVLIPELVVRSGELGTNARALIRFPLSSEAPGCVLESATLRLYSEGGTPGRTLLAIPIADAWSENGVTWMNQPATVGSPATTTSGEGYREWNVTAHVTAMRAGTLANHGWLIRDSVEDDPEGPDQRFLSRETPQDPPPITLPQLVLRYVSSGPTPTPNPQSSPVEAVVFCGQVITESTLVMNDLEGCLGEGLIIGAPDIILDLNGHTITSGLVVALGQEDGLPAGVRNAGHANVTIRNGTVRNFGYGVRLIGGARFNVVEDMTLEGNLIAGVELFDADDGRNGNTIRNNLFTRNGESAVALIAGSENSVVIGNRFESNGGVAVLIQDSSGHRIESNNISGLSFDPLIDSDAGIYMEGSRNNRVISNTLSDFGDAGVIILAGSHGNHIEGNVMTRAGDAGVSVQDSDHTQVINNISHLSSDSGISLSNAHDGLVLGNDVRFNPSGINLSGSSGNVIQGNDASYSQQEGIQVGSGSLGTIVRNNVANLTGATGISVEAGEFDAAGAPVQPGRIEDNTANENLAEGISVAAGGHLIAGNNAHNNSGSGISAEGNVDGGGNRASGNVGPDQCLGVVCTSIGAVALTPPDTTPPDTTITVSPANPSDFLLARFEFTGTDDRVPATALRFECRMDPVPFTPPPPEVPDPPDPGEVPDPVEPVEPTDPESWTECVSPTIFQFLEVGTHTFQVRATDAAGNTDFTHASYTWTVTNLSSNPGSDNVPPQTTITEAPANPTTSDSATFRFRGSDNDTPGSNLAYQCRLDSSDPADFAACVSPVTYTGLGGGPHTFEVRAVDASGNVDLTPALHAWSREGSATPQADVTSPSTTILSGPHVATVITSAAFAFASDEAGSTFECSLDGAAFTPCASPVELTAMPVGAHVFRVQATDLSGNTDPTPAEHPWTIGPPPVPTVVTCGQVLTESTLLLNSIADCLGDGLVIGADGITIDLNGQFIDGTNLGAGIRIDGFDAVTITNGYIQEFDAGVQLNPGSELTIVESINASLNELAGIQLSNADRNILRQNTLAGNGSGIELLNDTQDTLVMQNSLGSSSGDGIRVIGSSRNRFQGNLVVGSSGDGFLLEGSTGNVVLDNTATGNSGDSIALTLQSSGNRVEGNTLSDSDSGVHVLDSSLNEIVRNSATWSSSAGVFLENAHRNVVQGNDVRFNSSGLELKGSTRNRLEANNASQSSGTGISLEDFSLDNEIVMNVADFNAAGIYIGDLAPPGTGNIIERNTASHNSSVGIHVGNIGHVIAGNVANDNGGWGIYAATGTVAGVNVDGGGNRAIDNTGAAIDPLTLQYLQCFNVVCDGGPALATDPSAPETDISGGPGASTHFTSATFAFSGSDNQTRVRFQCRLDGFDEADFAPCESPVSYTGLALGAHTFQVRAIDYSGNVDATPATYAWTIEALPVGVPPTTSIDSGPDPITVSASADFTFSANEPFATFECSLDGADFAPCSSPATYAGLLPGPHELQVRAVDVEGIADPSPEGYEWTIGAPAVEATVSCGQVISQSTRVLNDLLDCPGNGLVIGAEGITLDLNGHTIDGIGLGAGILNNGFDSVTITNGLVLQFDFGVELNPGTTGNIISGLTLNLNQEAAIQLSDADGNTIRASFVSGNELGGNELGISLINGTQNTLVSGNTISGNPGHGLYLLDSSQNRLEGNTISANSGAGMLLESSSQNVIRGNTITVNSGGGLSIGTLDLPSNDNLVERNVLSGNSEGILVDSSSGNRLLNNRLELNDGGIGLDGATGTLVRGNDLRGNSGGIELSESSGNRLEANNASGSNGTGIALESLSLNNVILLNTASANTGDGISVSDVAPEGSGNRIEQNTASNNGGDGIFSAAGHTLVNNTANFNDGWGIFAEPGAIDGGGNAAAGNVEPQQCSGIVCSDGGVVPVGAPDTLIVDKPPLTSNSRNALFTFTGTDDTTAAFDLGFECRLDSTDELAWLECDNPYFLAALSAGMHRLEVRAVDLTGQVDPSPAVHSWSYVPLPAGVAPDTVIDLAPGLSTPLLEGFFTYSSSEPDVIFECSLDGAAFVPCSFDTEFPVATGAFEFAFEDFQVGPHTFQVRAIDFEGNVDATPAAYSWMVQGLITIVTAGPAFEPGAEVGEPASGGETESTSASFEFHASVADATFLCSLDLGPFTDCTSPISYVGLSIGEHLLRIIALDPEEQFVQVDPVEYEWMVILGVDTVAPDTFILTAPANGSSDSTFTFTGLDDITQPPALAFECRVDSTNELDWFGCVSPFNVLEEFPDFALGQHVFEVRAIDDADPEGNVDPTPARYVWTSVTDVTPPVTTLLSGPPAVGIELDAVFAFSGQDNATPELLMAFECSIDGGLFEPCASPQGVQGLTPGEHTFQVRAVDLALNADPTPASYAWTVVGEPETSIASGPEAVATDWTATFTFASDQPGSVFTCSLDGSDFLPCSSPAVYTFLLNGEHVLEVQAINTFGLADSTPASYVWMVDAPPDATAPDTTIGSGPPAISIEPLATFTFSASEPATFECALDGGAFGSCVSPHLVQGLADGSHTFAVRAVDPSGNVDPSPASFTWTVDQPPVVTITGEPAEITELTSISIEFISSDPGSIFECWLDGAISPCTSPATYSGLALGDHLFAVRATNPLGSTSLVWQDLEWTIVPPLPPDTTLLEGPEAISAGTLAIFGFEGTDNATEASDLGFECSLDGAPFAACVAPLELFQLSSGSHTFRVRAVDQAGLRDLTPASYTWSISNAPVATVVVCGQEITGNTQVLNDLVDCPGNGLVIGAAGITLDLNGRTIDGVGAGAGILNEGFASVTITNRSATPATVRGFETGVLLAAETWGNVVSMLRVEQSTVGILLADADNGTVGNTLQENVVSGNGTGISLADGSQGSLVLENVAELNAGDGIQVASDANVITGNTSSGNGGWGIFAAAGNTDGGDNVANGNGNALQCSGVACAAAPAVETIPPETTISSAPAATTTATGATFAFSSDEADSTFECSLDGSPFGPCTSPRSYSSLATGAHTFQVRAIDVVGNVDPTPASHSWSIVAPLPPVTVLAAADAWIDQNSAASNKGTDSILKVQAKGPRDNFRGLVRFNLPAIPAGHVVHSATLRLYAASARNGRTLQAIRLAGAWTESGVTWSNQPVTAGAAATTPSGTGWRQWNVTSQVQAMFPAGSNHGLLIRDATESGNGFEQQFHAREKNENVPQLIITFVPAGS